MSKGEISSKLGKGIKAMEEDDDRANTHTRHARNETQVVLFKITGKSCKETRGQRCERGWEHDEREAMHRQDEGRKKSREDNQQELGNPFVTEVSPSRATFSVQLALDSKTAVQ